MNYSNHLISLDIHSAASQATLYVKKGDTNRRICAVLTENGKAYTISEECIAVFTGRKPDGHIVFNACTIEDNTIMYVMTPQTTAAVGRAECELKLYGANKALITSSRFTIVIEDVQYSNGDPVESSDEVDALTALLSDTAALKNELENKLANGEFVGEKGEKGDRGADGTVSFEDLTPEQKASLKGDKGSTGSPGKSCTHYWAGTELVVTSASGTSRANLKGARGNPGDPGVDGKDGYTPVKGTDYFTEADKAEMVAEVINAVGTGLVRKSITKNRHVRLEKMCPIKHEVKVTATTPLMYDLSVVITGKNLYPVGAMEKAYWVSLGNQQTYYPLDNLPPGDYVFSLNCPGDSIPIDVFSLQISSDDGASYTDHWLYGIATYNDGIPYHRQVPFTIKEGDKVRLWLLEIEDGYDSTEAYNCTECQIEHGSVATAYEEPVLIEGDGSWIPETTDPETRTYTSTGTEMNILTNQYFPGANVNEITYEVEYIASV